MATSPLYNWPEPDNTDLVKNGALAIRTMGNAIDTTMGTMTPKSTYTAKGSIAAATAASTPANLAVGNNGEGLIADSSTSTGLRYQGSQAAGRNVIINGNLDVAQRGTSFTSVASGTFTLDRWKTITTATTLNTTVTQDTSVPNAGSKFSIKVLQASNTTGVGEYCVRQPIETQNITPLAGNTVTVSFWYRSNLTTLAHAVRLGASTQAGGTDQAISFGVTNANTWEKKVLTFSSFAGVTAISTAYNAEGAILDIGFNVFGSASRTSLSANDYFQFTQVQVEVGSVNTLFSRAGGTISGELQACQRYYAKSFSVGTTPATGITAGVLTFNSVTTVNQQAYGSVRFPVAMRTLPTITAYSYNFATNRISDRSAGTDQAVNSGTVDWIGDSGFILANTSGGIVTTTGGAIGHYVASAEL